jgi:FkbM family methyltransferase
MIICNNIQDNKIFKNIKRFCIQIKRGLFDGFALISYSQEGEDLILRRIFENQQQGFYIDVGAHHPKRFSNTYVFYKHGWRGINIDAMPDSMKLFNKFRKRDINLEKALSDKKERLTYYMFNEPALNGFLKSVSEKHISQGDGRYRIISEITMETTTLKEILDFYLPLGQVIHFLSIDVEGLEMGVLRSNDWDNYKPEVILVEALDTDLEHIFNSELFIFLHSKGYSLLAKTYHTYIFKL